MNPSPSLSQEGGAEGAAGAGEESPGGGGAAPGEQRGRRLPPGVGMNISIFR